MSINVKTYSSTHNVWVAYARQICNVHAFAYYEEFPDGSLRELTPNEFVINKSNFSQGKENILGNNSLSHVHLDGEISLLPKSSSKSIRRSVSYTPSTSYTTDYFCEHISTPGSSCEGNSHYDFYRPWTFYQDCLHCTFDRFWEQKSVHERTVYYPDSHNGASTNDRYYRVDFPSLKTKDIQWQSSFSYYYTDIPAVAVQLNESGVIIDTQSMPIGLEKFGQMVIPNTSEIERLLTLPACSGAIEPDDLLVRLTKNIGSLRVNNLANIAQLRQLNELLPPAIKRRAKLFKTAAEFLLWWKYSYSTTNMDIEEMMKYYFRADVPVVQCKNKGFAHRATLTSHPGERITDTFTFYLGAYQQSIIEKFGLQLNLANTWDLIPFSFVVDWFTKIGDMLDSLDAVDEWVQVPLLCYISSRKAYRDYSLPPEIQAVGHLTLSSYIRSVSKTLPMTVVSPSLNFPRGDLLTALSLVIANKR